MKTIVDILVIMRSNLPRYKRSIPIYKALAGMLIPKDIIVYTPREVEEWDNVPQAFITTAVTKGKKSMKKNKEDIINSWMEKADRDIEVTKRELKISDPLTDIICFHAQQSAEKYMKAYLIFLDIEFQKTHDVEDLVVVAGEKDPSILKFKDSGAEPFSLICSIGYQ